MKAIERTTEVYRPWFKRPHSSTFGKNLMKVIRASIIPNRAQICSNQDDFIAASLPVC